MERFALAIAALAAPVLVACEPAIRCSSATPLVAADGGDFGCVKSEDCPRPSNVYVCVTHNDSRTCVECVDTHCVSRTPADCGATP